MLKTTHMIRDELKDYKSPLDKLTRMVKEGSYYPITKGLYEDDKTLPGYLLAESIYGPSYLSFEFALARYGLIPEAVYTFTSATFKKGKKKVYQNTFGTFTYRDIPAAIYPYGILHLTERGYAYKIASKEKALCDQVYKMPPVSNFSEMEALLFENLRIDVNALVDIDFNLLWELSEKYGSRNVKKLSAYLRKMEKRL